MRSRSGLKLIAVLGPVGVDGVDAQLARAERLAALRPLDGVDSHGLAPAMNHDLIPGRDFRGGGNPLHLEELEAAGQKAEGALEPVLAELASEITEAEPIGEGGVLKAIWNLTGAYETGVRFALRQIPVTQATVEICERFELNPYRLYSSSCALLASENGGRLAEKLKARGIEAAVIGAVRKGIAREMIVQEGQGFLERPQPDELLKAVPDYPVRKEADPEV